MTHCDASKIKIKGKGKTEVKGKVRVKGKGRITNGKARGGGPHG